MTIDPSGWPRQRFGSRSRRPAWSRGRWLFGPPTAAADLATVRAAVQKRYPDWPIEADDH